jgi:hypothetical protein
MSTIISGLSSPPIIMGHSFGAPSPRCCWIAAGAPPESRSTAPLAGNARSTRQPGLDRERHQTYASAARRPPRGGCVLEQTLKLVAVELRGGFGVEPQAPGH